MKCKACGENVERGSGHTEDCSEAPPMRWFGDNWGAPVCRETPRVDVPTGRWCSLCNEPIAPDNRGLLLPHVSGSPETTSVEELPMHLECFGLNVGFIKEVHVLDRGFAICGLPGVPSTWPEGHRWVRLEEARRATCPGCKQRASC